VNQDTSKSGAILPERGRNVLSQIRGWATLGAVAVAFPLFDAAQRLFIAPRARRGGRLNLPLLTRWQGALTAITLGIVRRIGGATIRSLPVIPGRPGTLLVMNHQSLLDIALIFTMVPECHPRIVTRRRYARGIPQVSHSLRLYEHPLVDPGRMTPEKVAELAEKARTSETPIAIFPEGTRTPDGEISRFRPAGLRAILESREWDVWMVVGDGMWRCARLDDFVHNVSSVEVRTLAEGPFSFSPGREDTDAFIDDLRRRMVDGLERLRAEGSPTP
jgi:1-acyl-sn-glycerol-3-phosphate acyltransferase